MGKPKTSKKTKRLFSFIPFVMLLLALIGGVAGWGVYTSYSTSLGEGVAPKSVKERATPSSKETSKEAQANVEAETQARAQARTEWGQLGDFFGGTLNPIFGFISVIGLFLTILYQSREMSLSTEELAKSSEALTNQNAAIRLQSFEQTFFAWLGSYRELVGSFEESRKRSDVLFEYRGHRALRYLWDNHVSADHVFALLRKEIGDPSWESLRRADEKTYDEKFVRLSQGEHAKALSSFALKRWGNLYDDAEYQLDSLFRVLFNLIRWVDTQSPEQLSNPQKWLYVSIVRAQLSWIELAFLFCNGYTPRGRKFKVLAEKYSLFNNLPEDTVPIIMLLRRLPPDDLEGYAAEAFDSELARQKLGLPASIDETLALAASPRSIPDVMN